MDHVPPSPPTDHADGAPLAAPAPRPRKIIHIDMDAFYASVEQRDNPDLRGKPVAVGGSRERGVVAAASYEARRFGVHSAMPSVTARRKCADLIFVKPRFDVYKDVSRQIRAIFARYTPIIEPLSLDEAYLDVSDDLRQVGTATRIAQEIRAQIREETGLTASAGVSYNKFLAKLASDHRKPDGLFVITPDRGAAFVETLPVSRFHGIGPVTTEKMKSLGILTGQDLRRQSLDFLTHHFGKAGLFYYDIARAEDHRPVCADRERKSIGAETTFNTDLFREDEARDALAPLIDKVWHLCVKGGLHARTVTLKVKYADFQQVTRSRTLPLPLDGVEDMRQVVGMLLAPLLPLAKGVRLLGVTLATFSPEAAAPPQLRLL